MKIALYLYNPLDRDEILINNLPEIFETFNSNINEVFIVTNNQVLTGMDLLILPETRGLDTTGRGFGKYLYPPDYPSPDQGCALFWSMYIENWIRLKIPVLCIGNSGLYAWRHIGGRFDYDINSSQRVSIIDDPKSVQAYVYKTSHGWAFTSHLGLIGASHLQVATTDGLSVLDIIMESPRNGGDLELIEV